MTKPLAIFGADGATGLHACAQALERGWHVRAFSRDGTHPLSGRAGLEPRAADVLEDDLAAPLKGCDAVLCCTGVDNDFVTLASPPPLYTDGTMAICDGMEANGIRRLIVISGSFVDAPDRGPIWFQIPARAGLARVFAQMQEMEERLEGRDAIDWTAVRPGWLMEGEITRDYVVQADVIPEGLVRTRQADVAHFMLDLAEGNDWLRQTPALAREEDASATSPAAVAKEFAA